MLRYARKPNTEEEILSTSFSCDEVKNDDDALKLINDNIFRYINITCECIFIFTTLLSLP